MPHLNSTIGETCEAALAATLPSPDETAAPLGLSRDSDSRRRFAGLLPADETVLWQGAPKARLLARHVLRIRLIMGYFLAAVSIQGAVEFLDGAGVAAVARSMLGIGVAALAAFALLALFAQLIARSTLYTITDRRVVLRFGIALPVTLNLPLAAIRTADLQARSDGSGGIALGLTEPRRVFYVVLWPHARPWRFGAPQPMLRGLPDARAVAAILSQALRRAQSGRRALHVVAGTDQAPAIAPEAA